VASPARVWATTLVCCRTNYTWELVNLDKHNINFVIIVFYITRTFENRSVKKEKQNKIISFICLYQNIPLICDGCTWFDIFLVFYMWWQMLKVCCLRNYIMINIFWVKYIFNFLNISTFIFTFLKNFFQTLIPLIYTYKF